MKLPHSFAPSLLKLSLAALTALTFSGFTGAAWAADAKAPFKVDLAKGATLSATCQGCHVADGSRGLPANPILQGQHPEYITKQLGEFKSGKRENAIMKGMSAVLSDEDAKHVAAFYASKQAKPGFAKDKNAVLLGEKIYRGGVLERNIPACAGCHSPNGAGIPAQYPRVAGQHPEYTEAQLVAFRAGTRANSPQMTTIAGKLNDKEIKAVSDYMAGLQ